MVKEKFNIYRSKFRLYAQKTRSSRYWPAVIIALLVLAVVIGAVQASGPARRPHPPDGGGWDWPSRPWTPGKPVPMIKIVAVEKNVSVTFKTENLPEDEDFTVTMGYIYTRGKNGIVVGDFNSGDGESQELTFQIPDKLLDEYRIAIRAQTDHRFPYYAFNWFYNNSTKTPTTNGAVDDTNAVDETQSADPSASTEQASAEVEQALLVLEAEAQENGVVPSFEICSVVKNEEVSFMTSDFPEEKVFTVKMGVMPSSSKMDPYYDGRMKPRKDDMQMGEHGKPPHPMPPMVPPGKEKSMQPSKIWIPYYEAGTFESDEGGTLPITLEIPNELKGAYKISIMMYSDDAYPYFAYNYFYNNDAEVCTP